MTTTPAAPRPLPDVEPPANSAAAIERHLAGDVTVEIFSSSYTGHNEWDVSARVRNLRTGIMSRQSFTVTEDCLRGHLYVDIWATGPRAAG